MTPITFIGPQDDPYRPWRAGVDIGIGLGLIDLCDCGHACLELITRCCACSTGSEFRCAICTERAKS